MCTKLGVVCVRTKLKSIPSNSGQPSVLPIGPGSPGGPRGPGTPREPVRPLLPRCPGSPL